MYANITNATGLLTFMQYANTVTDGYYGIAIVLAMFVISFLALKTYSTEKALLVSAFICTLLTILLRFMDLISNSIMVPVVVLGAFTIFWAMGAD